MKINATLLNIVGNVIANGVKQSLLNAKTLSRKVYLLSDDEIASYLAMTITTKMLQ